MIIYTCVVWKLQNIFNRDFWVYNYIFFQRSTDKNRNMKKMFLEYYFINPFKNGVSSYIYIL